MTQSKVLELDVSLSVNDLNSDIVHVFVFRNDGVVCRAPRNIAESANEGLVKVLEQEVERS